MSDCNKYIDRLVSQVQISEISYRISIDRFIYTKETLIVKTLLLLLLLRLKYNSIKLLTKLTKTHYLKLYVNLKETR
jgi:hypothetical protein